MLFKFLILFYLNFKSSLVVMGKPLVSLVRHIRASELVLKLAPSVLTLSSLKTTGIHQDTKPQETKSETPTRT